MKQHAYKNSNSITWGDYRWYRLIAMLFVVALTQHVANAQSNLIANPGFETTGASGWTETTSGSYYIFDATASNEIRSGTYARGYWMNPGTNSTGSLKQTISNVTGGTYSAVIWTRKENYGSAFNSGTFKVLNGSTVLASGNLPSGGSYASTTLSNITITGGTNVTFEIAWNLPGGNGYVTMDDASFTMTSGGTVATPTFSPAAGTYTSTQLVTISTATSGATIRYTTDGSTPTGSSTLYSGAISVSTSKTVKAIGIKSGSSNSALASAAYTINLPTVATPTFSPAAGTYTSTQSVTISTATSGASIRYTTDGSTPTGSSTLYSGAISVSTSQTVKAIGIKSGSTNSAVASAAYTINSGGGSGTNLLTNPGFETSGGSGWTQTLSASVWGHDASGAGEYRSGTKARSYWCNSGATGTVTMSQTMNNVAGGTYTAVAWTRRQTWGSAFNYATFKIKNGGTTLASGNLQLGSTFASNTLSGISVTAGSNITFEIAFELPGGNGYVTVDDVSFTSEGGGGSGTYYVSTSGTDSPSNGTSGSPWRTVAYAASQVAGGQGYTISVGTGTFSENSPIILQPKVNLTGVGQSSTIITKSGSFDTSNSNFNIPDGSLIQLVSSPLPSAPVDGSQTISNLKVDGASRAVKAGVWVQNRNNVTMTNVTITNTNYRGAVFSPGYKDWFIEPQYYMTGINVNNCTLTNTSKDVPADNQSLGALCISGLDGADINNITISENQGYGIKFIYDGYFKNTQIHDCNINVPETDPQWGEDIAIEFWNAGVNNQIYNITCNTWLSLVNHAAGPFGTATSAGQRLKVYGIKMIDGNASSGKEAVEAAIPGLEIYNSYFQNKGFGVAIWDAGGKHVTVRNCTFYNSTSQSSWASGAVYIDNSTGSQYNNIYVYNNIFDAQSNAVNIKTAGGGSVSGVNIKNNAFLNGTNADVTTSGSSISNIVFTNNLKGSGSWSLTGVTTNSNNYVNSPGYAYSGNRYDANYYAPTSGSYVLAKGTNVGLPYTGSAPEIGRYEWTGSGGREINSQIAEQDETNENVIKSYPNPTRGMIRIASSDNNKIVGIQVMNLQGKTILSETVNQLNSTVIDLSQYANDIYIFRVKHQEGVDTRKVVLMK